MDQATAGASDSPTTAVEDVTSRPVISQLLGLSFSTALAVALFAIGTTLVFYVAFEVIRFGRFCRAIDAIEKLGGTIHCQPEQRRLIMQFVFSRFTADLSNSDIRDETCPPLAWIPFLETIRLAGTPIGHGTLKEVAGCHNLVSLDLSSTAIVPGQLNAVAKLKRLKSIIVD